ncbi:unnamed protein product [Amoebophrya sp. A120]|nr:unnamed protein product [Amoebophrya sp. A120]|eukprot:GSA120T00001325001.1
MPTPPCFAKRTATLPDDPFDRLMELNNYLLQLSQEVAVTQVKIAETISICRATRTSTRTDQAVQTDGILGDSGAIGQDQVEEEEEIKLIAGGSSSNCNSNSIDRQPPLADFELLENRDQIEEDHTLGTNPAHKKRSAASTPLEEHMDGGLSALGVQRPKVARRLSDVGPGEVNLLDQQHQLQSGDKTHDTHSSSTKQTDETALDQHATTKDDQCETQQSAKGPAEVQKVLEQPEKQLKQFSSSQVDAYGRNSLLHALHGNEEAAQNPLHKKKFHTDRYGSFGHVYKVKPANNSKAYAVKVVNLDRLFEGDPEDVLREGLALDFFRNLKSKPAEVCYAWRPSKVYTYVLNGREARHLVFSMPFVNPVIPKGTSFMTIIRKGLKTSAVGDVKEVRQVFHKMLRGHRFARKTLKAVHHDIDEGNVMITTCTSSESRKKPRVATPILADWGKLRLIGAKTPDTYGKSAYAPGSRLTKSTERPAVSHGDDDPALALTLFEYVTGENFAKFGFQFSPDASGNFTAHKRGLKAFGDQLKLPLRQEMNVKPEAAFKKLKSNASEEDAGLFGRSMVLQFRNKFGDPCSTELDDFCTELAPFILEDNDPQADASAVAIAAEFPAGQENAFPMEKHWAASKEELLSHFEAETRTVPAV